MKMLCKKKILATLIIKEKSNISIWVASRIFNLTTMEIKLYIITYNQKANVSYQITSFSCSTNDLTSTSYHTQIEILFQ